MDAQTIRQKYLEFFTSRQHALIPRSLLVPQNDPTTLFTGSGMQPLMPYLLGQNHPSGRRLVNSQTCLRAQDIEEVGDNRHTTFFEMLGNWSLGDYGKQEQITWFWEFLTDVVGLDPTRIYVSCFIGEASSGIERDDVAAKIWQKLFAAKGIDAPIVTLGSQSDGDKAGMQGGRIFFYDDGENWWSRGGGLAKTPIGDPCGPDSEVFYDFGDANHDPGYGLPHPASDSGRFMEIGNQVFMQYQRTAQGFESLQSQNVDFGGGLERISAAAIDSPDVFKISLLWPIITNLEHICGKSYADHTTSMRVIADHFRAATFLAIDGVAPSNKEQGYVMRRLIRRAIRFGLELGIDQNMCQKIVPVIIDIYSQDYPEVAAKGVEVVAVLEKEERAFRQTLRKGLKLFDQKVATNAAVNGAVLTGNDIFTLYDTYGFPTELSIEEAHRQNIAIAQDASSGFGQLMEQQRDRSRTATKGEFKGGLGGQTLQHKKYHTATHLMYQALRDVLGGHVVQRGSNMTEERLRFDFSHDSKVTPGQIEAIEAIVNDKISQDLPITWQEYLTAEAIAMGALGAFGDRYGDTVKVYQMGTGADRYSFEICGGPHVDHTGELAQDNKVFKIIKEEASSAGIRRIKAILA